MRSTIQEVAVKAGVSTATVSRVFNTPDQVTVRTREAVRQAAIDVGYVPNASARTLRTHRSRALGVVLPSLLNPVFAECLQGIAKAAMAAGYSILPITSDYRRDLEEHAIGLLTAANVDGLILVMSDPATSPALSKLSQGKVPYVLAYNRHLEHPCVSTDSEKAVDELVQRLARLGHRDIAMVSGELATSDRAQQRYRGYLSGMRAASLKNPRLIEVPFVESSIDRIIAMIDTPQRPTALVCSNDLLAIRCIRAARLIGLQVPDEITITGFDGISLGLDMIPMLSTISQPNDQIGSRCVELIMHAIETGVTLRSSSSVTLPHQLREGESIAAPAVPAARRSKPIRSHKSQPLG